MKDAVLLDHTVSGHEANPGESYSKILGYFYPEFISGLVLYSLVNLIDSKFIGDLQSTASYATSGTINTLFNFIIKLAEGLSIGTIILCGIHNGAQEFKKTGRALTDAFWITFLTGLFFSLTFYFGADFIFYWYGVPASMVAKGVPFLRIRSIGIFFVFMYFSLIGFMRGVKNTKTPMYIFMFGSLIFIFFDYALIFGKFGFPALQLQGSALASVIQYAVMSCIALIYILTDSTNKRYAINLFQGLSDFKTIFHFIRLSLPSMADKATMALAYVWLSLMVNPMGKNVIASYTVIKDMERLAFIPALAFAQVITLLASNDSGIKNYTGIISNLKKILMMATCFVFLILAFLCLKSTTFVSLFDHQGDFTTLSCQVFPILTIFVFFDLTQLILSATLRGASDVKTVMWTRVGVITLYFIPVSFMISQLPLSLMVKFTMVYISFYIGNAIMCAIYIKRLRGNRWKRISKED